MMDTEDLSILGCHNGETDMFEKFEISPSAHDMWSQLYRPVQRFGEQVAEFFSPSSEAATTEHNYEIIVELPGVSEKDISVEVTDGRLIITGEKRAAHEEKGKDYYFSERVYGKFRRVFSLPDDADTSKIAATQKDGVLTIMIAKVAPKLAESKKIDIVRG